MTEAQPNLHRRRLGLELRSLRKAAGQSLAEAAEQLDLPGAPSLSRIENGKQRVAPTSVLGFFEVYGLRDEQRRHHIRELAKLANTGRRSNLFNQYRHAIPDPFADYVQLEELALKSETFAVVVPGLLQTEEYARAIVEGGRAWRHQREIQNFVELRMARQRTVFNRENPLQLWCVLDEAALLRRVGSDAVMKAQLEHLLALSEEFKHVDVQVLPFDQGAHAGVDGDFHLLHFAAGPPVAVVEPMTTSLYLEEDGHLARYESGFDHLRTEALNVRASREHIRTVLKERYS
ncbi:helix-turn-helix domain-containing protein [Streptomyces profundus]|uniref:helix-turn-helix domain-containing protein n=1 Tax=Streptomyces profundus TaxID=2867410 RepID=UPI001D166C2C|nr:helix-turn-helix transcriptional regulator [Streptomyces sp. MA3_2.13]UED83271.1 helix-turn-helix domain-containing protein [Streptomyces sp. MA3_2.13]